MIKKFVFRSNKYNITHQDIQRGIEDRGYVDENYLASNQTNPLDKWSRYDASRVDQNVFPSSSVNIPRAQIHDAVNRLYDHLQSQVSQLYVDKQTEYRVGYNFNKQKLYNYIEEYLLKNPSETLSFTKDPQQFLVTLPGMSVKNILVYQGKEDTTNTTLPFLKTNIGEKVGHHKDGRFEKGLQGPFTEKNVGGYKHRHQNIGTTNDRPERFNISDNGTIIRISSPISGASGLDYSKPYARYSRGNFVKSVYNIQNIRTTGSNTLGNFSRNYEIVSGLHRRSQNLALVDQPQNFPTSSIDNPFLSGTIKHTLPDRRLLDGTYNKTSYVNKFSSPGDIYSRSPNYMDSESEEYSPYSTINYRNIPIRQTLKTYLSTSSYFGGYLTSSYGVTPSYQKAQRNNRYVVVSGTNNLKLRPNNGFISYQIPARDGGFSWIRNYASGGINSGLINNGIDNDIIFVTNSIDNIGFSTLSSSFYSITYNSTGLDTSSPTVLRSYNIKFNGLWNFTSKKQLSQNLNKVIVYSRQNNYYSDAVYNPFEKKLYKETVKIKDSFIKDKHTNVINVYVDNSGSKEEISYPFGQKYASLVSDIYVPQENQIINIYQDQRNIKKADKSKSLFKKLLDYDRHVKENNINFKKINEIKYEEKLYPRGQAAYRDFARIRNAYSQSWSDNFDSRLTELVNSQGRTYSAANFNKLAGNSLKYSYWPLDANTYYDSVEPASRDKSGELLQLDNPSLYATSIGSTYTIVVPSSSYYGARFGRNWNINRPANVVHEQAGRGPYFNVYNSYVADIKLIGQGCSVIPEYRISPKLDLFYSGNVSYYDDSFNSLELTGTIIDEFSQAVDAESAFMEQRAHSDLIDLNEYLNEELQGFKLNSIKFKIKGIKKLLPYDEFYPQTRMLKLAQQFSSSYGQIFYLQGGKKTFRTALAPMYAPGIAFNSIKSGVGMPYSIAYTSSAAVYINITSSIQKASAFYQKLPWETILYPYKNLKSITTDNSGNHSIFDTDPDILIDSTASILNNGIFNTIYDRKANNFYSEVVNFFKKDKTLTSLNSKPDNSWYFPDLTKKYSIDLVINKTSNYYTYSSLENYGPRPYAFHNPPWVTIKESDATDMAFNSDYTLSPNYQSSAGESFARITFDPASLLVGSLDYGIQGKFKIGDVIRNSTVEVFSNVFGTYDPATGYTGGNISSSSIIQLTDLVDIFNVSSDGTTWQPKLKWECPTADLNFYNLSAKLTNSSGNDTGADYGANAIRGIWHQYAPLTENDRGLFLSVRNSNVNTSLTGSLLEIVGFDPSIRKKIGRIADSTEISEAIILIPFHQDNFGVDKYFDLDPDVFEKLYAENSGFVGELKIISRKYILPPALDFIKIRETAGRSLSKEEYGQVKSPCLMFGFQFTSNFTQQDLVDVWQGVLPSISTTADIDYQEKEFFIGNYLKDLNFKLPDNTRFKIFRVKQKAISNYQQIIDKTNGNDYINLSYGYNWPYDYCSLVEMAEIKTELVYGYDITEDNKRINSKDLETAITTLNYAGETGTVIQNISNVPIAGTQTTRAGRTATTTTGETLTSTTTAGETLTSAVTRGETTNNMTIGTFTTAPSTSTVVGGTVTTAPSSTSTVVAGTVTTTAPRIESNPITQGTTG